jgi:hypothetical protein
LRTRAGRSDTAGGRPISNLFPEAGLPLLIGRGRDFLEQLGEESTRDVVKGVLLGENVKSRTEPLTRRRLVQVNAAIIAMLVNGIRGETDFMAKLVSYARGQFLSETTDKISRIPAQWLLGLTQKQIQNVLRSGEQAALEEYCARYENALEDAAKRCESRFGPISLSLQLDVQRTTVLGWSELAKIFSAVGASTLAIRGSEKSMYGKVFERLVLGSCLTVLGFRYRDKSLSPCVGDFWLSDSDDIRECDATLIIKPGHVARFDLGFIGRGNPEIVKDKLSRFARDFEQNGRRLASTNIVIVDHVPIGGTVAAEAAKLDTGLIQMSLSFWPRTLAQFLNKKFGLELRLASATDAELPRLIDEAMARFSVLQFVGGLGSSPDDVEDDGT